LSQDCIWLAVPQFFEQKVESYTMAVPNLWRTKQQRYRLQAEVCPVCTRAVFPPREVCPHCRQPMQQTGADVMAFTLPILTNLSEAPALVAAGDD
jgi:uncharacterized OB-fold protein